MAVGEMDPSNVMSWAIQICGEEYFLSVYNDMGAEPQWRPEWADRRFIAADAFGRVYEAFLAAQASPASWKERVEAAKVRSARGWPQFDDDVSCCSPRRTARPSTHWRRLPTAGG
jgi:hypothetical protein